MHQYRSAAVSEIDRQLLRIPANKPPESMVAYLRSLRRYLEAKEAAKVIGCHLETLYGLISSGLPAEKRGRRWRIDPIRFADWLESAGLAPIADEPPEKHRQQAPHNN